MRPGSTLEVDAETNEIEDIVILRVLGGFSLKQKKN